MKQLGTWTKYFKYFLKVSVFEIKFFNFQKLITFSLYYIFYLNLKILIQQNVLRRILSEKIIVHIF